MSIFSFSESDPKSTASSPSRTVARVRSRPSPIASATCDAAIAPLARERMFGDDITAFSDESICSASHSLANASEICSNATRAA